MIFLLLIFSFLFVGVVLVLRKNLLSILMGVILLGNAANLILFYLADPILDAFPFVSTLPFLTEDLANPLPQALILTAIVISFALFCLVAAVIMKLLLTYKIKGDSELHDEGFDGVFK